MRAIILLHRTRRNLARAKKNFHLQIEEVYFWPLACGDYEYQLHFPLSLVESPLETLILYYVTKQSSCGCDDTKVHLNELNILFERSLESSKTENPFIPASHIEW